MKHTHKFTAALLLILPMTMTSFAAEPPKANEQIKPIGMHHGMGMGMGMMGGMTEEHLRSMQEHMLKMHDLSNQILAEKDPAKKESLKNEQLELMKAHQAKMMEAHQQKMQELKK
jgi:hypothetical protein